MESPGTDLCATGSWLVLKAAVLAGGVDLFFLDMGEHSWIIDLARQIVRLTGLSVCDTRYPSGEISFKCTGMRPGEKFYQELMTRIL